MCYVRDGEKIQGTGRCVDPISRVRGMLKNDTHMTDVLPDGSEKFQPFVFVEVGQGGLMKARGTRQDGFARCVFRSYQRQIPVALRCRGSVVRDHEGLYFQAVISLLHSLWLLLTLYKCEDCGFFRWVPPPSKDLYNDPFLRNENILSPPPPPPPEIVRIPSGRCSGASVASRPASRTKAIPFSIPMESQSPGTALRGAFNMIYLVEVDHAGCGGRRRVRMENACAGRFDLKVRNLASIRGIQSVQNVVFSCLILDLSSTGRVNGRWFFISAWAACMTPPVVFNSCKLRPRRLRLQFSLIGLTGKVEHTKEPEVIQSVRNTAEEFSRMNGDGRAAIDTVRACREATVTVTMGSLRRPCRGRVTVTKGAVANKTS
ncbi:hypothetical protein B0H16DRAFT_1455182 [Mycena metata]|uniref:Uncharacterized protein n=1 Tax=Mycena metata TaxID=1033252 RepID=A0AAD7NJE6_9AGAR|nr:hypothetical protein B0H16DRAFT_1455182 [Mycena metata]